MACKASRASLQTGRAILHSDHSERHGGRSGDGLVSVPFEIGRLQSSTGDEPSPLRSKRLASCQALIQDANVLPGHPKRVFLSLLSPGIPSVLGLGSLLALITIGVCDAAVITNNSQKLPKIRIARDGRTFVTEQGKPFVPFGVNYYRPGT